MIEFIDKLPDPLTYVFLGIGAMIENIFPPAPGDTIIVFGAFLVGTGQLKFSLVFASTTIGSLLGFMALYWLGGFLGRRFFIERDYRLFRKEKIVKAGAWFKKYGYFIILVNRFLPGIRSVISIAAGIYRLSMIKVVMLALISCSAWNLIWISIGFTLGNNWKNVEDEVSYLLARYNMIIIIFFSIIALSLLIRRKFLNSRKRP